MAGAGFFLIDETADALLLDPGTELASARFVATAGATYLLVLVVGGMAVIDGRLTIACNGTVEITFPTVEGYIYTIRSSTDLKNWKQVHRFRVVIVLCRQQDAARTVLDVEELSRR